MTTTRNTIIRMTNDATGAVTYVTARGNAKARGKAHAYTADAAARAIADFASIPANAGFSFDAEAI